MEALGSGVGEFEVVGEVEGVGEVTSETSGSADAVGEGFGDGDKTSARDGMTCTATIANITKAMPLLIAVFFSSSTTQA